MFDTGQLINSPLDMMALDEGYVSPSTTLESVKMEPSPVKIVKKVLLHFFIEID